MPRFCPHILFIYLVLYSSYYPSSLFAYLLNSFLSIVITRVFKGCQVKMGECTNQGQSKMGIPGVNNYLCLLEDEG